MNNSSPIKDSSVDQHQENGIRSSTEDNAINKIFATAVTSPTSNREDNMEDKASKSDSMTEGAISSRRSVCTVFKHKLNQIIL